MRNLTTTFLIACLGSGGTLASDLDLKRLTLDPGFRIEVWVEDIPNARQMALSQSDTLFVGSRSAGNVYAVSAISGMQHKLAEILVSGLKAPAGVAMQGGDLYVSDVNRILKFPDVDRSAGKLLMEVVYDQLPDERMHGWKNIAFGPDGKLYIPVGAPCNVCNSALPFAALHCLDLELGVLELVAEGIRNTVGFDWHPETGELWFTDNGRDLMGDDMPPDEVNRVSAAGQHFGYPFVHGEDVRDTEFFEQAPVGRELTQPALEIQAHSAPLGIHFYRGDMFPESYQGAVLVAEHGSWNRSEKVGYQVSIGDVVDGRIENYRPFIRGWLQDENLSWGRPVAFLELNDGSLLISDDYAGVIYRVSYDAQRLD